MSVFLFWNLNKKPLKESVTRLAWLHRVDVLMLAECEIAPADMLLSLNAEETEYHYASGYIPKEPVTVYTRFHGRYLKPVFGSANSSFRLMKLPVGEEILLAMAHMPGKLYFSPESQAQEAISLSRSIQDQEAKAGHSRTVLVGDFNMNPFEAGIIGAQGLHAMMTRQTAQKGMRRVQGNDYPFFYNPMWRHFGDAGNTPAGTYYYERAEHVTYFWNMFDQVMVRPELLPRFRSEYVQILTTDGTRSLITEEGLPDRDYASDHLPLLFALELE